MPHRTAVSLLALSSLVGCAQATTDEAAPLSVDVTSPTPPEALSPYPIGPASPNTLSSVALKVDGPYSGNIVKFELGGQSYVTNPSCQVSVTYSRLPNLLHPAAVSFTKGFTVAKIPSLLETVSLNEAGAWTVVFHPVQSCSGKDTTFRLDVLPTAQELEPKIYGLEVPSDAALLTDGQSGTIRILGKGDLTSCVLDLSVAGPVAAPGVTSVAMNGKLSIGRAVAIDFPAGAPSGVYQPVDVWIQAVSGCTLANANGEGKLTASFKAWSSL